MISSYIHFPLNACKWLHCILQLNKVYIYTHKILFMYLPNGHLIHFLAIVTSTAIENMHVQAYLLFVDLEP